MGAGSILCDGLSEGMWDVVVGWDRNNLHMGFLLYNNVNLADGAHSPLQSTSNSAMKLWQQFVKKTKSVAPIRCNHQSDCSFQEDLRSTLDQKWVTPARNGRGISPDAYLHSVSHPTTLVCCRHVVTLLMWQNPQWQLTMESSTLMTGNSVWCNAKILGPCRNTSQG